MTMTDDDRVVTLLREVDLPMSPPDRLAAVTRRARRGESRRATGLAAVMAVVLTAGVVSALSLHDRSGNEELTVAAAARATKDTGSARVTYRIEIPGGAVTLSGPVDFANNRYQLAGTFGGSPLEIRGIGTDRWTKGGGIAIEGKQWVHSKESAQQELASTTDPVVLLDNLVAEGKQLSSRRDGERRTLVLRVPESVVSGSDDQTDLVDVTVLIDADDLIRSLTYRTGGVDAARLTIRYDDFGVEVDVQPPPADQVREGSDTGISSEVQSVPLNGESTPEQRRQMCEQFKAARAQMPAPQTEQEKAQRAMLDRAVAQACAKG